MQRILAHQIQRKGPEQDHIHAEEYNGTMLEFLFQY